MTDEELDLLASSYLDGEATPDEVAMIERDPSLLARVETLRSAQAALRAPMAVPADVREQQLAAALSLFDGSGAADRRTHLAAVETPPVEIDWSQGGEPTSAEPVIDLRSQREARARERDRWQWASAAAAAAVLLVGGVFLAGQLGSESDFEAAINAADESEATDSADESADNATALAEPAAGDDAATESADADTAGRAAMESEAMAPDAEEDFAADEAGEATADAAEEAADDAADGETAALPPIFRDDVPEAGFFPDEPVITYSSIPTSEEIVNDLSLRWRGPENSECLAQVELPAGSELIAYLPIEVTLADGSLEEVEALYLVIGNGAEILLVDPEGCQAL